VIVATCRCGRGGGAWNDRNNGRVFRRDVAWKVAIVLGRLLALVPSAAVLDALWECRRQEYGSNSRETGHGVTVLQAGGGDLFSDIVVRDCMEGPSRLTWAVSKP
jgi:hypothetical protein